MFGMDNVAARSTVKPIPLESADTRNNSGRLGMSMKGSMEVDQKGTAGPTALIKIPV
jgi:hypothetical protein